MFTILSSGLKPSHTCVGVHVEHVSQAGALKELKSQSFVLECALKGSNMPKDPLGPVNINLSKMLFLEATPSSD